MEERSLYPHLSHHSWSLTIDGPRMRERENLFLDYKKNSSNNNNNNILPPISSLPIFNPSFDMTSFDRGIDLPKMLNNQDSNNYTNNNQGNNSNYNQGNINDSNENTNN